MAKIKNIKARILLAVRIEGINYQPDDVIEADSGLIAAYKEQGVLDDDAGAVLYCTNELGKEITIHVGEEIVVEVPRRLLKK